MDGILCSFCDICGKEFDLFQLYLHECPATDPDMSEITNDNEKQNTNPDDKDENSTETICGRENELDVIIVPDNTDCTNICEQTYPKNDKDQIVPTLLPTSRVLNVTTAPVTRAETIAGTQSDNFNSNELGKNAQNTDLIKLPEKSIKSNQAIQSIDLTTEEDEEDNWSTTLANSTLDTNSLPVHRFQVTQSPKAVFCEFCGSHSSNPKDLESHQMDSHANKHFMCYICGELFLNTSELMFHNAIKHCDSNAKKDELNSLNKTKDDLSSSKFRYYCNQCGQGFDLIYLLFIHKKNLIKLNQHDVEDGFKHILTHFDLEKKKKIKPSPKKAIEEDKNTDCDINKISEKTKDDTGINQQAIKDVCFLKPVENKAKTGKIVKKKETCVNKSNNEQVNSKNNSNSSTQNNADIQTQKTLNINESSEIKKIKVNVGGLVTKRVNKFSKNNFILKKKPGRNISVKNKAKKINTLNVVQKELNNTFFIDNQKYKSVDKDKNYLEENSKHTNKNPSINDIDPIPVPSLEIKKPSVNLNINTKSKSKENLCQQKLHSRMPKLTKAIGQRETKPKGLTDNVNKLQKESPKKREIETQKDSKLQKESLKKREIETQKDSNKSTPKPNNRKATEVTKNTYNENENNYKEKQTKQKPSLKNISSKCNNFSIDDILNETNKDLNKIIHRHDCTITPIKIKQTVLKEKSQQFTAVPNLQLNSNPLSHANIGKTSSLPRTNNSSVAISTEAMQIINEVSQQIDIYNTVKKVLNEAEFSDDAESDSESLSSSISTIFCEACGGDCKDSESLFEHMTSRHPGFNFVCFVCYQHFKILDDVINHQIKHSKDNLAIAEKQFLRIRKSNSYPYYCNKCGKGFTLIELVANHKKNAHYDKSDKFKDNRIIQKRKSIESGSTVKENKQDAMNKDKKTQNRQADDSLILLKSNSRDVTQNQTSLQTNLETNSCGTNEVRSDPNFPRFCEFCGQKYNSYADQKKDIHLEKYKCVICHKPHDLLDLLVTHYDTCHAKHEVANFEKVQISLEKRYHYFCRFCGGGFNFIGSLLDHRECNHFDQILMENENTMGRNNSEISMELTDPSDKTIEDKKKSQYKTFTEPVNVVTHIIDDNAQKNCNKGNCYNLSLKKNLPKNNYLEKKYESQKNNTETAAFKEQSQDKFQDNNTKLSDIAVVSDTPNENQSLQEKKYTLSDLTDAIELLDASNPKSFSSEIQPGGPSNFIDMEDFFKEKLKSDSKLTDTSNTGNNLHDSTYTEHIGSQEWDELDKELDNVISLMTDDNSSEEDENRDEKNNDTQSSYCEVCGLLFQNIKDLLLHFTGNHREKPFKCSVCVKIFADVKNVIKHQDTMHKPSILMYAEKYYLGMIAKVKQTNFLYYCSRCGKGFNLISNIKEHYKVNCMSTTSKSLKRKPPSATVTSLTVNTIRLDTIKSDSTPTNSLTNKKTNDTSKVEINLDMFLKNPIVETNASNNLSFLMTNNKSETSDMSKYTCSNCNKSFSLRANFTFHKLHQCHLSGPSVNPNLFGKPFKCPVCPNRTFGSEQSLKSHLMASKKHILCAEKQKIMSEELDKKEPRSSSESRERTKFSDFRQKSTENDVGPKEREDQQQQSKRVWQESISQEHVTKKFKQEHCDKKKMYKDDRRKRKRENKDKKRLGGKLNAARPAVEVQIVKKDNKDDGLEGIYTLQEARNLCNERSYYY